MKVLIFLFGLLFLQTVSASDNIFRYTPTTQEWNGVDSSFMFGLGINNSISWDDSQIQDYIDGSICNGDGNIICKKVDSKYKVYIKNIGDVTKGKLTLTINNNIIHFSDDLHIDGEILTFSSYTRNLELELFPNTNYTISLDKLRLTNLTANKNKVTIKSENGLEIVDGITSTKIKEFVVTNTDKYRQTYNSTNILEINGNSLYIGQGKIMIGEKSLDLTNTSELTTYSNLVPIERINPFTDIDDSFAKEYILNLSDKKIINGYEDKTFKPDNSVTRAEFLKMIMNKNKIDISSTGTASQSGTTTSTSSKFSDTSGWIVPYAEKAKELGFIQSSDKFNPNNKITRAEAIKILLNVSKKIIKEYTSSTYKDVDGWKINFVETAKDLGIINSSDFFRPNDNISRAESSKIIDLLK